MHEICSPADRAAYHPDSGPASPKASWGPASACKISTPGPVPKINGRVFSQEELNHPDNVGMPPDGWPRSAEDPLGFGPIARARQAAEWEAERAAGQQRDFERSQAETCSKVHVGVDFGPGPDETVLSIFGGNKPNTEPFERAYFDLLKGGLGIIRTEAIDPEKVRAEHHPAQHEADSSPIPDAQATIDAYNSRVRAALDNAFVGEITMEPDATDAAQGTGADATQVGGDHYKKMGAYQPWIVLEHWLTPEEFRGYQKGVAIAYLARERSKGGDKDIAKANHHLAKLLETLD